MKRRSKRIGPVPCVCGKRPYLGRLWRARGGSYVKIFCRACVYAGGSVVVKERGTMRPAVRAAVKEWNQIQRNAKREAHWRKLAVSQGGKRYLIQEYHRQYDGAYVAIACDAPNVVLQYVEKKRD